MNEKIKRLTEQDLTQCVDLFIHVFNQEPWNDNWTTETAYKRLHNIFNTPGFVGMGIIIDDRTAGMACGYTEQWTDAEHFNLVEFCIDVSLQRTGLGTRLLNSLEDFLSKQNCSQIYLLTMRDGIAESFYSKNAYYTNKKMIMMGKKIR